MRFADRRENRAGRVAGGARPVSRKYIGRVETLEGRQLLAASLAPIAPVSVQQFLGYQVPLNGAAANAPQTFTVQSDNPSIPASVAQGKFLTFNVNHASSGANDPAFNGSLTFQLFDDLTPLTTSKIEELVNSGFYTGKNWHRIAANFPGPTDFIVQGGSVNGAGNDQPPAPGQPGGLPATGFPFRDEFNAQLAFTGTEQLAMANAGDDTNTSQFFATTGSPQFLNFQHTIFGQLVSGQDVLTEMTQVAKGADGTTPVSPILISSATLSDTNPNGVIHIDATRAPANSVANVTVTATDASTNTTATQTFTVLATPATDANNSRAFLTSVPESVTVGLNQQAIFQVVGTGPEPTDTLTYRVAGGVSGSTFTSVQNATATVDANGVVTVIPTAGYSGPITLLVGVRDQVNRAGGTLDQPANYDTQTLTITVNASATPVNLPPIALPVNIAAPVNATTPIQLLGNTANPGSAQTLSYNITQPPLNGTLSTPNQVTGVVTYTPRAGYTGPDFFSYTVTDVGAPTPNLTSAVATVQINVTQGSTQAVRVIGGVLVVTPPPRTDGGVNTILVDNVAGVIQVTVNGIIDATQPQQSALDRVVVFGSKASDRITVAPSVQLRATLDGGHGGRNVLTAGSVSTRLHGWFGKNRMIGSPQADAYIGRKGHVKFIRSGGQDLLATGEPNNKKKGSSTGKEHNAPKFTFAKFVRGKLVSYNPPAARRILQDVPPPLV